MRTLLLLLLFLCLAFCNFAQDSLLNYDFCRLNLKKSIYDEGDIILKLLPDPLPSGSYSVCGNGTFRLIFMDIVDNTNIGFDDPILGATRMDCACQTMAYIEKVIDIPANIGTTDPTIDIIFNHSVLGPSNTLGQAYPVFPPTMPSTPGYYGGYLYDYITTGVKPDPTWEEGRITINFGLTQLGAPINYNYCTSFSNDCAYDFSSLILHEMTHLLGMFSSMVESTGTSSVESLFPQAFSEMDRRCLYHNNGTSLDKMADLVTYSGNGGVNPAVTNLSSNNVWMYDFPLATSRENQPVNSGPSYNPLSSLCHFDRDFSWRTHVSPGFSPNYVMESTIAPHQYKDRYTTQELRWLEHMGYTVRTTYQDQPLISNSPAYTLGNVIVMPPNAIYPTLTPPAGNSNLYFTTSNCTPITIPLSALGLADNESDPITVYQPSPGHKGLYNLRGCGDGNNADQLAINAPRNEITFYPRQDFIGRAQFAFHLYDGKERGSYIVVTVDVTSGCFENNPPDELVVNGNLEQGIQYRELNAIEDATLVDGIDIFNHYAQGWRFVDAMQYTTVGWQDPYLRDSYKECLFGSPYTSFDSPGIALSPASGSGNRYVHSVFYAGGTNEAFNLTLGESMSDECTGNYVFECDVYVAYSDIPSPYIILGFNNAFDAYPSPMPSQNQSFTIPVTTTGVWEHITFPFTYTSATPSDFMYISGLFATPGVGAHVLFDNFSLTKAGPLEVIPLNDAVVCSSGLPSSVVIGHNPGATGGTGPYTYSWSPGTGLSCTNCATPTASPSVTTTYTLTVTDANGCTAEDEMTVTRINCICSAVGVTNITDYSWNNSFSIPSGSIHALGADVSVTGNNVVITDAAVSIAPAQTITIQPGATLTLDHCHLYSCDDMWQGIVIEPGGTLNIINGTLIEDAIEAVDITGNSSSAIVLNVNGAIFNKNRTAIHIDDYQFQISPYPFLIQDAIFTSRSLAFTATTWPATSTLKNLINSGTLSERYDMGSYSYATLKAPYSGQKALSGVTLTDVGTLNTGTGFYYDIMIGEENNSSAEMNVFDNLQYGIDASNSDFTVYSSTFQNILRQSGTGGIAIRAIDPSNSTTFNRIRVLANSNGQINWFYDCSRGIEVDNYDEIYVHKSDMRSTQQAVSTYPVQGEYGVNIRTPHCKQISAQENVITNIRYGIAFTADVIGTVTHAQSIGPVTIHENTIRAHMPSGTTSNPLPLLAILADNIIDYSIATLMANGDITITNNHLYDVHNGIVSNNWYSSHFGTNVANFVYVTSNYVRLRNYTMRALLFSQQLGIQTTNCYNPRITSNNVIGFITANTSTRVTGIYHGDNIFAGSLPIRHGVICNTTERVGRGITMYGNQAVRFHNNTMDNCYQGFVISNTTGSLFATPGYTASYDNKWTNFTLGSQYKTHADASDASDAPLVVRQAVSPYDPADNAGYNTATTAGNQYTFANGLSSSTGNGVSCVVPSSLAVNNGQAEAINETATKAAGETQEEQTSWIERMINSETGARQSIISQHDAYLLLYKQPGLQHASRTIEDFYKEAQKSNIAKLVETEVLLAKGKFAEAAALNKQIVPENAIEENYKKFYSLYLKGKNGNFSTKDSLELSELAQACPATDGKVVYKARVLYHLHSGEYHFYDDNCGKLNSSSSRPVPSSNMIVYPNPGNGNFTIRVEGNERPDLMLDVTVTDMQGKVIEKQSLKAENSQAGMSLKVSNGVYLVSVKDENGMVYTPEKITIIK